MRGVRQGCGSHDRQVFGGPERTVRSRSDGRMNLTLPLLVLLLPLCCSGFTQLHFHLAIMAEQALRVSLASINNRAPGLRLYGVTNSDIEKVTPVGVNTYGLSLKFTIRETDCVNAYGINPRQCGFRHGYATSQASCFSRVLISDQSVRLTSLRCSQADSSSSESSSEEISRRLLLMNRQHLYRTNV